MVYKKGFVTKLVWPLLVLTLTVSCNEQEFYEKSFLQGAGVDRPDNQSPVDDADFGDPIGNVGTDDQPTDPNNGGTDGGATDVVDNGGDQDGSQNDSGNNTDVVDDGSNPGDSTDVVDNGSNPGDSTDVVDNGNNPGDSTDVVDNGSNPDDGGDDQTDVVDNGNDGDGGSNDEEEEEVIVGPVLEDRQDLFTQAQEKRSKVDILWVIDDSGSMADEQAALAYNFDAFITGFLNENVDFKMGITTTDGTSRGDGKWAINYKHLTREQANKDESKFLRDFKRSVQVGTRGSAKEMGLQTAKRFLERYDKRIPDPFQREDAYLIVVILSDEEDQSQKSTAEYVEFLKAQKANESLVKVYSIVAVKKTPYQWETVGNRYMQVSDETNGVSHHIKDNFYHILKGMGSSIVELTRSFALSATPYNNEMIVKVNGEVVTSGWSYQEETKSISFLEDQTPAAGSSITVEYKKEIKILLGSN